MFSPVAAFHFSGMPVSLGLTMFRAGVPPHMGQSLPPAGAGGSDFGCGAASARAVPPAAAGAGAAGAASRRAAGAAAAGAGAGGVTGFSSVFLVEALHAPRSPSSVSTASRALMTLRFSFPQRFGLYVSLFGV